MSQAGGKHDSASDRPAGPPQRGRGLPSLDEIGTLGFSSIAVHAGERLPASDYHPIVTPISASVGFEAPSAAELDRIFEGTRPGYNYTRHGNPTCAALEETMKRLENGRGAIAFSSGMAALHAAFIAAGLRSGDTVVSSRDIYGATYTLLNHVFGPFGVATHYGDPTDFASFRDLIRRHRPRVVFIEAISNPLVRVADLPAVVDVAREAGAITVVDSTFASPLLLRPLAHGVDFAVHSSTKYLNGHGDALGGIVICRNDEALTALRKVSKLAGGVLGPFEAYLTLRGIKTLALRMPRQCRSAHAIAERLAAHPGVERVHYPGLPSHRDHVVAQRLFGGELFGAVVSFELRGAGRPEVFQFMDRLRLCCVAPTVGDIFSQLLYPRIASHRDLTPEQRAAMGIGDNLVRLSVGIEEPEDLISDLDQAIRPPTSGG
jgi:cystathionine beta-lyase/cystathionine gamma-synthase